MGVCAKILLNLTMLDYSRVQYNNTVNNTI